MQLEWWQWALTLLGVAVVSPIVNRFWSTWWDERRHRRKKTQKLLTEDAFKTVFNESILPDLVRQVQTMIEAQIRARVHARYLKRSHDSDVSPSPF